MRAQKYTYTHTKAPMRSKVCKNSASHKICIQTCIHIWHAYSYAAKYA